MSFLPDRLGPSVLYVQYAVTKQFINYWWKQASGDFVDTKFEVFPMPNHIYLWKLVWRVYVLGWVITLIFLGTASMTVQLVVQEKENKEKEAMQLMGMSTFNYWLSWFVANFTFGLINCIVFVLIFFWNGVETSEVKLLLAFSLVYLANTITFAFMISCFINKASHAIVVSSVLFVLTRLVAPIFEDILVNKFMAHIVGCIFYQTGIQLFYILMAFQIEESEFDTRYFWPFYQILHQFTHVDAVVMLLSNTMFNLFVVWCMETGLGDEAYLCLQSVLRVILNHFPESRFKSWSENVFDLRSQPALFLHAGFRFPEQSAHMFEVPSAGMESEIEIRSLVKVFNGQVCVSISDLEVYKEQITVLLGDQGSGKTTLFNLMAGILAPTRGYVHVRHINVTRKPLEARENMGLCRQNDVLFDQLTCREHIALYCNLKERYTAVSKKAAYGMLFELGLMDKTGILVGTLSPGERRKLSVACAFVADSKIVLLDEPSYGLDHSSCYDLWLFLKKRRHGRTIFMTSRNLEEADGVGDRIMIMSKGCIKCCGSPDFLRKPYGSCYKLTVVKYGHCDVKATVNLIKKIVPSAWYMKQSETELIFLLPEADIHRFSRLLVQLQAENNRLNVIQARIVIASFEEIIHSIVNETTQQKIPNNHCADILLPWVQSQSQLLKMNHFQETFLRMTNYPDMTKVELFIQQMKAVLVLKYSFVMRNPRSSISFLLLPLTLVFFGMILDLHSTPVKDARTMNITPGTLPPNLLVPVFVYLYSRNPIKQKFVEIIKNYGVPFQFDFTEGLDDSLQSFAKYTLIEWPVKWSFEDFKRHVHFSLVSTEDDDLTIKLYYSRSTFHGDAIGMQLLMSAWVKQMLGEDFSIQSAIQLHPNHQPVGYGYLNSGTAYLMAVAMAIVPLPFAYNIVSEKQSGVKKLQYINGLSPLVYWLGHFIFDVAMYLLMMMPALVVLLFSGITNIHLIMLFKAVMAFGFFFFPHIYVLQFIFKRPATAVSFLLMVNVFFGVLIGMVLDCTMELGNFDDHYLISLISETATPNYSLCVLLGLVLDNDSYKQDVEKYMNKYWTSNTRRLCIAWSIVASLEFKIFRVLRHVIVLCFEKIADDEERNLQEEDDVSPEWSKNESSSTSSVPKRSEGKKTPKASDKHAVSLAKLRRNFYCNFRLVNALRNTNLMIGVNNGLGLIGPAGSGKSVILKVLAGELEISSGDAYVYGQSLKTDVFTEESFTSYCPQKDALCEFMTAKEMFRHTAKLRGLPQEQITSFVENLIDLMDLRLRENDRIGQFSCDLKRAVSVGLALIGHPKLFLLDNATVGLSREARDNVLRVLRQIKTKNGTLVMSTTSNTELEALCNQLVVLLEGRIVHLGSPHQLMSKYGSGHFATLFAKSHEAMEYFLLDSAAKFMLKTFKSKIFLKNKSFVVLHIPEHVPMFYLYETLEKIRLRNNITRYTVSEVTLDKILIMLVKKER
ncbi:ATP-binding cassette sub-family A member 3 [Biomphalaria glabrata]|nr:ATP-binding cassette sub-family A member 3 [Biomphalaria glabrata]